MFSQFIWLARLCGVRVEASPDSRVGGPWIDSGAAVRVDRGLA